MNIVTDMILPSGWHYNDPQGYRIPMKSELPNARAVIDALIDYRLENNLPVGNPEQDLEDYVCKAYPTWCRRNANNAPQPIENTPGKRNVDLVIGWANELYTKIGRLQLVPQKEAEERATICKACPKQMEWARDCPPCVTSAQRLLSILRQGKDTAAAQMGEVTGCSIYGWDNRTACHLDSRHLPKQPNPGAPAQCWVSKLGKYPL